VQSLLILKHRENGSQSYGRGNGRESEKRRRRGGKKKVKREKKKE